MPQLFLAIASEQQLLTLDIHEKVLLGREAGLSTDDNTLRVDLTPYRAYALGVSRRHTMLSCHNDDILVFDLASSNGTYLNGNLLVPHQGYPLSEGDALRLGQFEFRVYLSYPKDHANLFSSTTSTIDVAPNADMQLPVSPSGEITTLTGDTLRDLVRSVEAQEDNKKQDS